MPVSAATSIPSVHKNPTATVMLFTFRDSGIFGAGIRLTLNWHHPAPRGGFCQVYNHEALLPHFSLSSRIGCHFPYFRAITSVILVSRFSAEAQNRRDSIGGAISPPRMSE